MFSSLPHFLFFSFLFFYSKATWGDDEERKKPEPESFIPYRTRRY
jgi:hypothetical protein